MTKIPKPSDWSAHFALTWDSWNRLVKIVDGSNTVQENSYDALNRRVVKKVYVGGSLDHTRHLYFSDAWQVLEERKNSETRADRQLVWGLRYIDDLVLRDRDADGSSSTGALGISGSGLEERFYALQDPNWNVTAIADASGVIQERFVYSAYGTVAFMSGAFAARSASSFDWEILWTGAYRDSSIDAYLMRHRYFYSRIGRWVSRDLLADLNRYFADMNVNGTDPLGLFKGPVPPMPITGTGTGIGGARTGLQNAAAAAALYAEFSAIENEPSAAVRAGRAEFRRRQYERRMKEEEEMRKQQQVLMQQLMQQRQTELKLLAKSAIANCIPAALVAQIVAGAATILVAAADIKGPTPEERLYQLIWQQQKAHDYVLGLARVFGVLDKMQKVANCRNPCPESEKKDSEDHHVIPIDVHPPFELEQFNLCCLPKPHHNLTRGGKAGGGSWYNDFVRAILDALCTRNWERDCLIRVSALLRMVLPCCEGPGWCRNSPYRITTK